MSTQCECINKYSQITDDSLTFMVGGLHTSGYFLVWAIHYMSLYPEIAAKVIEEMKEKVGDDRDQKLKDYVYSTDRYRLYALTSKVIFYAISH